MRVREWECRSRIRATLLGCLGGTLHGVDKPRRSRFALIVEGVWLGYMLGDVDFFQDDEILFFLHDLWAVSLDKANGGTAFFLQRSGMRLPGSYLTGVLQRRTVQSDGRLEHAQVDARIGIGAGREDLRALDHGEPEYAFPRGLGYVWLWGEGEDGTERFGRIFEAKPLLVYFDFRVVCQGDGRVGRR